MLIFGAVRTEAFVSKKVATVVTPKAGTTSPASTSAPSPVAAPAPAPVTTLEGMSVALQAGDVTAWIVPHRAQQAAWTDRKWDSIPALAAVAKPDEPAPGATAGAATYVWMIDGAHADRVLEDRRPSFVVQFKDVPGISPDELSPIVVKLASVRRSG